MSTKQKMSGTSISKGKTKKPPTRTKDKSNAKRNKTPIKEANRPATRRKTESEDNTTPKRYKDSRWQEQDYLQLSLRITEDIISTQRYKNEEMAYVLKRHYQANKAHLDKAKLLKTIAQLCSELSISMDPDFIHFLDDTENNYKVCAPKNSYSCSPLHFESNPSPKQGTVTKLSDSLHHIRHSFTVENQHRKTNYYQSENTSRRVEETCTTSKSIEVVKPPPLCEKTSSNIFEFNEEVLDTLVGKTILDSGEDVLDKEMQDCKEFQDLNDATLVLFYFRTLVSGLVSTLDKMEKNLVAEHYSVSVEPERIDKREFSVQVTLDATNENQNIVSIVNINNDYIQGLQFETVNREEPSLTFDEGNVREVGAGFENSPYLVLDYPVLDLSLSSAENEGQHHKSVLDIHVPRTTANSYEESWSIMNLINNDNVYDIDDSDHYDLTPQKEVFSNTNNKKNNFLEDNIVLSYNQTLMNEGQVNKSKNASKKKEVEVRNSKEKYRGRGERYKKVYENLSCFYPTTATQVNSVDILDDFCREAQVNTSRHVFLDSETSDQSSYNTSSSIQKALPLVRGEARRSEDAGNNYRLDAKPNHNYHEQPRREVNARYEQSKDQSNRRRSVQFVTPEEVDDGSSSGRSVTIYSSTENMQKRIMGLKFGIERYRNDYMTPKKVKSPRRVEMTGILKNYTLGSASTSQSSESSQNRPKRFTILRKHAKMKF